MKRSNSSQDSKIHEILTEAMMPKANGLLGETAIQNGAVSAGMKADTSFTMDMLTGHLARFKPLRSDPNPFRELAKRHGFALDKGDLIIVPQFLIEAYPEFRQFASEEGVRVSRYVDQIYLLRNPTQEIYWLQTTETGQSGEPQTTGAAR